MTKIIARPGSEFGFFPKQIRTFIEDVHRELGTTDISKSSYVPRVNISEDVVNIYVHAEIPGMAKEAVKVTLTDGVLTLRGEKRQEAKKVDQKFFRIERRYGEFVRQFTLPENVNEDAVSANFTNGVLEIMIPKKEPEKPKEREVPINFSVN